jgi:hypothetical protein
MKSLKYVLVLFLCGSFVPVANAEVDSEFGGYEIYHSEFLQLWSGAEVLMRNEIWDWFGDQGDAYSFRFQRTRLNLGAHTELLDVFVQPQYVSMWGLPSDAVVAGKGPSGMGALYYLHNQESDSDSLGFHQAWIRFNDLLFAKGCLTLGRMTYASGVEHVRTEDGKKFNTLKSLRLGDRLISSFEWSAYARSFDGVKMDTNLWDELSLTASWLYPTQGGWEKDFNTAIDDVRVASVVVTAPKGRYIPDTELQFFVYNYQDERNCTQRVDNSGCVIGRADIDITAIGAHLVGIRSMGTMQWDYLLWGAIERGDWYEQDHAAYAFTVETGWQWMDLQMKPWLRIGYFIGSGDKDPNDEDHGTFFQMAPGTRKYQLFPYYDLQNNQSIYGQLFLFPHKDVTLRFDYAFNQLAESSDSWYMGTGSTQDSGDIFGYLGRSSGGDHELSQELSMMLNYQYNEHLGFNFFYAHVWGGDVIENIYPSHAEADYASIEATYKF